MINVSTTEGNKNQNQLSESINEQIKVLTTIILLEKKISDYKAWRKNLLQKFMHLPIKVRARNAQFRKEFLRANISLNGI